MKKVINDEFKIRFEVEDIDDIVKAMSYLNRQLICGIPLYVTVGDFIEEIVGYSEPRLHDYGWDLNTGLIDISIRKGTISKEPVFILDFINDPIPCGQMSFY